MKKVLSLAFLIGSAFLVSAQMTLSSGSQIVVASGSTLVVNDVVNTDGKINNSGTVQIKGDLENNTSGLMISTSSGILKFNGSSTQEITGDADASFYGTVEIDNSNGVSIKTSTGHDQTINGTLTFTNGLLTLNEFDLTLFADATTPGAGKYVQTNSTGYVKRSVPADGSTNVTYPIGNSTYNPLVLQNDAAAVTDNYNVRVIDDEPSGSVTSHFVDRSWVITEDASGDSDLSVTPQWNSGEVLTDFDSDYCSVGLTSNGGTDYSWTESGGATGTDPFTKTGTSFTTLGTFAIGDYFYSGKRLNLKLFLAGAYNGTTMDQDLKTADLIPTQDPYSISTDVTTIPATAVDWVKVELRDQTTPTTVLHSFAFFVDVNGNILDRDGNTGGKITGATITTPYNVAVLHRNHFGIMSSTTVNLDVSSPSFDFSTALSQAWDNTSVTTNDAMKDVSGVFCLWDGDANGDGYIKYNGSSNDKNEVLSIVGLSSPNNIVSSYSASDLNMDGEIKYNGSSNDKNVILSVVGLSTPNDIKSEHMPNL